MTLKNHVRSDKAKWWVFGIALLLLVAIAVWLIIGAVKGINPVCLIGHEYGDDGICKRCGAAKPVDANDVGAGLYLDESKVYASANGITLRATRTTSNRVQVSGSTYTLTLNVEPLGATDYFEWNITGNEDGGITLDIAEDRLSAVITCNKAFSVRKAITVVSQANTDLQTEPCYIDYYKRVQSVSIKASTLRLNTTSTEYTLEAVPVFSVGTITPEITLGNGTIKTIEDVHTFRANAGGSYGSMYSTADNDVSITNGKFTLIMSPSEKSSFQNIKGTGLPAVYASYFKQFISTCQSSSKNHYRISVNWIASINDGHSTIGTGTATCDGRFDVSGIAVNATGVSLSQSGLLF